MKNIKFPFFCISNEFKEETGEVRKQQHYERTFITFLNDPNDEVYKKQMKVRDKSQRPMGMYTTKCALTKYKIYMSFLYIIECFF